MIAESPRSVIATALKHLIAAGVSGEALLQAVAEIEAAQAMRHPLADATTERRRARDRAYQAAKRRQVPATSADSADSAESADSADVDGTGGPPNEYISNPPSPPSSDDDCPPLPVRFVAAWNEAAARSGLVPARGLDAGRRAALKARVREHGEAALFDAVRNLAASKFHCGGNDRGWRATIGWLLKSPENFLKALELPAPADPPAEAMDDSRWNALCDRNVALFRRMRRDEEARGWERRKRPGPSELPRPAT